MCRKLVMALIVLLAPASVLADYAAGVKAFDSGDFATAHGEWLATANQGDTSSLLRLGQLYEDGVGVPQNFEQAHVYYNLAGARGSADARQARDALAANMPPDLVARAQDKAAAWRPVDSLPANAASVALATSGSSQAVDLSWSGVNEASVAVLGDELQKLKRMLASGTDPNVRLGNGDTLLLQAVRNSSLATVQALLAAGADPNTRDAGGWTALKAAIYGNRTDVARSLLRAGANPADPSPDGMTALSLSQRLGQADMMVLFSR